MWKSLSNHFLKRPKEKRPEQIVEHERQFLAHLASDARRLGWNGATPRISELPDLLVDGVVVGTLEMRGIDHTWVYGIFHPGPNFERLGGPIRDLERAIHESEAADEGDNVPSAYGNALQDKWFDLMEELDQIVAIQLAPGKTIQVRDFKVQNGWYEYRMAQQ
jgi:hypothetical protein